MMVIGSLHTPIVQVIQATGKIVRFQIVTSLIICIIVPIVWIFFTKGCRPTACYWIGIFIYVVNQFFAMRMLKDVFDYNYFDYCKEVIFRCFVFSSLLPIIPFICQGSFKSTVIDLLMTCTVTMLVSIPIFCFFVLNRRERLSIYNFMKHKLQKNI